MVKWGAANCTNFLWGSIRCSLEMLGFPPLISFLLCESDDFGLKDSSYIHLFCVLFGNLANLPSLYLLICQLKIVPKSHPEVCFPIFLPLVCLPPSVFQRLISNFREEHLFSFFVGTPCHLSQST